MTTAAVRSVKPLTRAARRARGNVVVSNPDILGGVPVFAGTRVPFKNLIDYLAGGDPLEEFLDQFPTVSREQAIAALGLALRLMEDRARPPR